MNKTIRRIILCLFVLFATVFITSSKELKADAVLETDAISYLGASVRLSGEQGIRFTSQKYANCCLQHALALYRQTSGL